MLLGASSVEATLEFRAKGTEDPPDESGARGALVEVDMRWLEPRVQGSDWIDGTSVAIGRGEVPMEDEAVGKGGATEPGGTALEIEADWERLGAGWTGSEEEGVSAGVDEWAREDGTGVIVEARRRAWACCTAKMLKKSMCAMRTICAWAAVPRVIVVK